MFRTLVASLYGGKIFNFFFFICRSYVLCLYVLLLPLLFFCCCFFFIGPMFSCCLSPPCRVCHFFYQSELCGTQKLFAYIMELMDSSRIVGRLDFMSRSAIHLFSCGGLGIRLFPEVPNLYTKHSSHSFAHCFSFPFRIDLIKSWEGFIEADDVGFH